MIISEIEVAEFFTNELVFSPLINCVHGWLFQEEDVVQNEYDVNLIHTFYLTSSKDINEVFFQLNRI